MAISPTSTESVSLSRIFLNSENPRHERMSAESATIEYLCKKENILELARDIVRHGINPLELTGLVPIDKKKTNRSKPSFIVAEGNRRICALKLLIDPDLAPAQLRKSFEELSKNWNKINAVTAVIFNTMDDARIWMDRIHNGFQDGIGRKNWNADQKARNDGGNKNKIALGLLDYAEKLRMITADERARKLTTAQRFLSNDVFREMLGVDRSDPKNINRIRPKAEFDILVKTFVRDLVGGQQVHSRMNRKEIISYTCGLKALPGVTSLRIDPEPLAESTSPLKMRVANRNSPRKPEKIAKIRSQDEIFQALRVLGNNKLQSLYHSICNIELEGHTPLVSIGTWAFFETLTACAGRNDNVSFDSFLSKARLLEFGITTDTKASREAMSRISAYGNTTKHHPVAATFNGDQLDNDMHALKDVVLACIMAATKPTG